MPTIINELEVVMAPPEAPAPAQNAPAPGAPAPGPLEIAALLERRARQELRLFAH